MTLSSAAALPILPVWLIHSSSTPSLTQSLNPSPPSPSSGPDKCEKYHLNLPIPSGNDPSFAYWPGKLPSSHACIACKKKSPPPVNSRHVCNLQARRHEMGAHIKSSPEIPTGNGSSFGWPECNHLRGIRPQFPVRVNISPTASLPL